MIRISARMMVVYKWIAPAMSLLILAAASLQWSKSDGAWPWYFWVFFALAIIAAAAHGVKMGRLADEVVDHGDYLRVRRGSIEESIPIADIEKISSSHAFRPARVTLLLRRPGRLGDRVSFIARENWLGFYVESTAVVELRQRIALKKIHDEFVGADGMHGSG
ncbi:hypothetical protein IEQ11_08515 [Lysobacter capsici]|uniref:hypothetical protein n=1 Tax=Lysobacter capsici TaxID=435897 RepID=UPI00177E960E|nr:hypothetical protein [Lysobacter capsici]UOF16665.1 hypothetical protein IEQ11_08515 [Lysobacter capsici]